MEEMPSRAELLQCLDRAQVRWQQIREAAYRELEQEQGSGSATCHRVFPSGHGGGEPALGSPLPALSEDRLYVDGYHAGILYPVHCDEDANGII